VDGPAGQPALLATHVVTDYAQRNDPGVYIVDRVCRTTTYEVANDGSRGALTLRDLIMVGKADLRVIGQTLQFYDGPAFQGLPFRQLGNHGALVRSESLVVTRDILHDAYRGEGTPPSPAADPPYLAPGAAPAWTADYPQEFRNLLPPMAGYVSREASAGSPYVAGYFAVADSRCYDFQLDPKGRGRGLIRAARDALGHETATKYDAYDLFATEITNPAGLVTHAAYDYRVLQPCKVTDPNGNRTLLAFSPLGFPRSSAIMGKDGEKVGDTPEQPGTQFVYDLLAFDDPQRRQPISVRTIRRVHHVSDADVPDAERGETMETVEYSDGFERVIQVRTQAEDVLLGDGTFGGGVLPAQQADEEGTRRAVVPIPAAKGVTNVVVSGWKTYDNKGRAVEQYEPFFSAGWAYAAPKDAQLGQKATMEYDPRGRLIRTVNPDRSEQRVVEGVPGRIAQPDLTNPAVFEPTPWEAYTYDANDNAGRTHPDDPAARAYRHHWDTPSSVVVDALGRSAQSVQRNRAASADGAPLAPIEEIRTRSTYDIRGNVIDVIDPLGRRAFHHVYDLVNRPLRIESIDAGTRRTILDAAGNEIERRDSKGALVLHAYDALNRPTRLWARDGTGQALGLRERIIYGESQPAQQARSANLLGKRYQHYDEAGLLTFEAYDFKGNILEKTRKVISDAAILAVFSPPPPNWQVTAFQVDWEPATGQTLEDRARALLDAGEHRTSITYDALNRVKMMHYPQAVDDARKTLHPHYNRAGTLERVEVDGKTYVERIAYNAKGQRTLIAYGNGLMSRYAYETQTFRLARLRTESFTSAAPPAYAPAGQPLQDFAYTYDLVGNITSIQDRAPGCGVINNPEAVQVKDPVLAKLLASGDGLLRHFAYDPLYRLLSGTGRECDAAPAPPWIDVPRCTDLTRTRAYTERYQYDSVGNMLSLQHSGGDGGFNRDFALATGGNHLATMKIGADVHPYAYDANGNLVQENTDRHFDWDHIDRMRAFRNQAGTAEPSVHAHYLYDAVGQRVKKLVRKQGGQTIEVTIYIDGLFEHRRLVDHSVTRENFTLHVMDNQSRIALIRVGPALPGDNSPAVQFHLGDHLGSSQVVLDDTGKWINREEYTPYGETSFGSFAHKRYRFTGKERDEESGLYYHGARYYAPWLARWVSCDPAGPKDRVNLYVYARNNGIRYADPNGLLPTASDLAARWQSHEVPITGEDITAAADRFSTKVGDYMLQHDLPGGQVSTQSTVGVTAFKTAFMVAAGAVATVLDPGSAVRGIMRLGEGTALGWEEIKRGQIVLGTSHITAEVATVIGLVGGAVLGARAIGVPGTYQVPGFAGTGESQVQVAYSPTAKAVGHLKVGITRTRGGPTNWFDEIGVGGEKAEVRSMEVSDWTSQAYEFKAMDVPESSASSMLEYAKARANDPGTFRYTARLLGGSNCTTFVQDVLASGGISVPGFTASGVFSAFKSMASGAPASSSASALTAGILQNALLNRPSVQGAQETRH
jgi:RHS repeat-associated protein